MPATATYLLDYMPVEVDRLLAMAQLLSPEVGATCRRAGLEAGGRAVDVGCGPLGAIAALADIVGPDGLVVGVDANAHALKTAAEARQRLGIGNVRLVNGDVNTIELDEIGEPSSFDLAFSRLTLMHQPDPGATMARIGRLLRPGGALVAFDLLAAPLAEPKCPALDRGWELLMAGMRRVGAHPETSRRYPELAASAGLEVVSQRGVFFPVPPAAAVGETTSLLRAARASLSALHIAGDDEVESVIDQLHAESASLTFATTPIAVELIARKPA